MFPFMSTINNNKVTKLEQRLNRAEQERDDMFDKLLEAKKNLKVSELNRDLAVQNANMTVEEQLSKLKQAHIAELDKLRKQFSADQVHLQMEIDRLGTARELHVLSETESLRDQLKKVEQKAAVLESENKLLKDALRTNEDILEVKNVIDQLIKKLPTVDLKNMTILNTGTHGTSDK